MFLGTRCLSKILELTNIFFINHFTLSHRSLFTLFNSIQTHLNSHRKTILSLLFCFSILLLDPRLLLLPFYTLFFVKTKNTIINYVFKQTSHHKNTSNHDNTITNNHHLLDIFNSINYVSFFTQTNKYLLSLSVYSSIYK